MESSSDFSIFGKLTKPKTLFQQGTLHLHLGDKHFHFLRLRSHNIKRYQIKVMKIYEYITINVIKM